METEKETKETFDCSVCGQTKDISEANYNCTGVLVCDDCQKDYYRH